MNEMPFIDWNGNGQIDPYDIAISLAIAEEKEKAKLEDDEDDIQ